MNYCHNCDNTVSVSHLGHSEIIPGSSAHSCRWSPDSPGTVRHSRASHCHRCHNSGHVGYNTWSWMGYQCQTGKQKCDTFSVKAKDKHTLSSIDNGGATLSHHKRKAFISVIMEKVISLPEIQTEELHIHWVVGVCIQDGI